MKKDTKVVMVGAIKGGTGKSLVAINLAYELSKNFKVGLLDADIDSPNIAEMLGIVNTNINATPDVIIPVEHKNIRCFSMSILSKNKHISLYGQEMQQIIEDLLTSTQWGDVDYLIVDLPAGSSDIFRAVVRTMADNLVGFVFVGQPLNSTDFVRCISLASHFQIPIIGAVENMCGYECPHCHKISYPFGHGSIQKLCKEYGINFCGVIPLSVEITQLVDQHDPIIPDKFNDAILKLADACKSAKTPKELSSFWKRIFSIPHKVEVKLAETLVDLFAEFIMTANTKVNIAELQKKYNLTKQRVVTIVILSSDRQTVLFKQHIRVRDGQMRFVKQPEEVSGVLIIPIDVLAKILKGKETLEGAWLSGDIMCQGKQATNAVMFFTRNVWNEVMGKVDFGYFADKILSILSEANVDKRRLA